MITPTLAPWVSLPPVPWFQGTGKKETLETRLNLISPTQPMT